jgi:hypothetical protein
MKTLIVAALALLLAACGAPGPEKPVVPDVPVAVQRQTISIPPSLIAKCPPLTPLDPTKLAYNQGESVDAVTVWSDEYATCSTRFEKFVIVVSKYLNINIDPNAVVDAGPSK